MKCIGILFVLLFSYTLMYAQTKTSFGVISCPGTIAEYKEPYPFSYVSVKPEYPGGTKELYSFIDKNFIKPQMGETKIVRVYINFIIEKDGSISNFKILRDPGFGLGKEALRVLHLVYTKWKPGILNDKVVRTSFVLPITVNLK